MAQWKDVEDYANAKGIPVQQAAQELGMNLEAGIGALGKLSSQAWNGPPKSVPPSGPVPMPERNDATLANQEGYEKNLSDKLRAIGQQETARQKESDSFNPDEYTQYAMGGEVAPHDPELGKPKFNHLKEMMKKHRKAKSELQASKDPMKFIQDNKNMSIKGLKGVAF